MRIFLLCGFVSLFAAAHLSADDSDLPKTTLFYSSVSGIGAGFHDVNGQTVVRSLLPGNPAEQAGLKPNDIVVEVDGKSVARMSTSAVVGLIRGPDGTTVKLVVERHGARLSFTIKRELIRIRRANSDVNPH